MGDRRVIAAQAAELGELKGQGYLAVRTEGYRRCVGVFRCRRAELPRVKEMLANYPTYRGVVYGEGGDIGSRVLPVRIRAFREERESLVIDMQAVDRWWEVLESRP